MINKVRTRIINGFYIIEKSIIVYKLKTKYGKKAPMLSYVGYHTNAYPSTIGPAAAKGSSASSLPENP